MAQAKNNAGWEGQIRGELRKLNAQKETCLYNNRKFPTGLLPKIQETILEPAGYRCKIVDLRKKPEPYQTFRWVNPPHEPRYYQKEIDEITAEKPRGIISASVASGKTHMMHMVIKRHSVNTLLIMPGKPLLEQNLEALKLSFGAEKVCQITTASVRAGKPLKPIRIATAQGLAALQKAGLLEPVFADLDMVLIEEFHHAGADTYTNLMPHLEHVYYRYGYSGTVTRGDNKILNMFGVLSDVLYEYPAHKGTAEGFLTPVEFNIRRLPGKRVGNYQKEYDKNYCGNPELLDAVRDIIRNEIPAGAQTLILVDRKDKGGKVIHEYLKHEKIESTYISGDDKRDTIRDAIQDFNDKKVKILVGSQVIGEGIDLRSTEYLIMCRGGKSTIAITQAIGRCVRLSEGKLKSTVFDFEFNGTKYLTKHLRERIKIYRNEFAGKIIEV